MRDLCTGIVSSGMFLLVMAGGVCLAEDGAGAPPVAVAVVLANGMELIRVPTLSVLVGRHEVSNAQYRQYKPRHRSGYWGDRSLDAPDMPVANVDWYDAVRFCRWLTVKYGTATGVEFDLPSVDEWIAAAECGKERPYPWGDEWPPAYGNYADRTFATSALPFAEGLICLTNSAVFTTYDDGFAVAAPVTMAGSNEWGFYGLAGNVSEWVRDIVRMVPYKDGVRYDMGESWAVAGTRQMHMLRYGRSLAPPEARRSFVGFRVVARQKRPEDR